MDREPLLPWYFVGAVAIICGVALAAMAVLGPLVLGDIEYRTSASGEWQIQGGDLVNLLLVVPILLLGGVTHLMRRPGSKYLLILPPVTLMYTGLSLGLGQEWGNPAYDGNAEQYAWLFLILIVGGLVLLLASLSMFTPADAPQFKRRTLRIYVAVMALFLLIFAAMWLSELVEVMSTGDTSTGSYEATPTLWWVVRYLDLGVTIPLGFIGLFLLLTRPRESYPLVLLFFGFFVTLGTAVLSMGIMMTLNDDPDAQPGGLPVFGFLAALSWVGLLYLVKDKLPWPGRARRG
ncbi:MAG: hypothetical protein AB1793_08650 [Candidatus Thermoplasmatota archaeon]